MALTRANVETILVKRLGPLMTAAGMATTVAGSNADLNDPIGYAIRQAGQTVDDLTAVDDTDVARIGSDDYDKLLDVAELRTLESIQTNLDDVDIETGPVSEKRDQLGLRVEKALTRKRAQVARDYGLGLGTLETGVIALGFQQRDSSAGS